MNGTLLSYPFLLRDAMLARSGVFRGALGNDSFPFCLNTKKLNKNGPF